MSSYKKLHKRLHFYKLCNHAVTRIILKRIDRIEESMGEEQFGFRKGKETRNVIGCLRMIAKR